MVAGEDTEDTLTCSQGGRTNTAIEFARRGGISTGQLLGKIPLGLPRLYTFNPARG